MRNTNKMRNREREEKKPKEKGKVDDYRIT